MNLSEKNICLICLLILLSFSGAFGQKNDTCLTCHKDSYQSHKNPQIHVTEEMFKGTVHDKFDCVDCHYKAYDDYPHDKFAKTISCAECHEEAFDEYKKSSHYQARLHGNLEAATCSDCHSIHQVKQPNQALTGNDVIEACSKCHADKALNARFQLNPNVVSAFKTSYHGQMYNLGFESDSYATCVSCHDNHAILDQDSPESAIAKQNIVKTCAKCHEDANENFVGYLAHYSPENDDNKLLNTVLHFLEILILGTMLVFGIHSILSLVSGVFRSKSVKPNIPVNEKQVRRFGRNERIQHILLAIVFLSLALTGLPLKFSDNFISEWIVNNLIGFHSAALLHRIAGVGIIVLFVYHLAQLIRKIVFEKKYELLWGEKSLIPNFTDVSDFFANIAYFLHLRKTPPRFGRWTYWEKFDYMAVFWGMTIIGSSGLVLMFPVLATQYMPGWVINLAHIVHSEEALLATAFIFLIHFFNTHFRPDRFSMDNVMFAGQMSLSEFKEERPLEYEQLKKDGKLDELLEEPLEGWKVIFARIIGFGLVLIGIGLLAVIIVGTFS